MFLMPNADNEKTAKNLSGYVLCRTPCLLSLLTSCASFCMVLAYVSQKFFQIALSNCCINERLN